MMNSRKRKQKVYNIAAIALLMVMLFPGLWMFSGKKFVRPLNGAFYKTEKPDFSSLSWNTWMEGSFQSEFEKGLKQHIGFHDLFVRASNSVDFHLFRKVNAGGVVLGKENQLFEYDYIRAMEGTDYLGNEILDRQIRRLKFVQEELKKYNTKMILVFEPSKARFYPEYIPDHYHIDGNITTNYSRSLELCETYDLEYLDLNRFFTEEKPKHSYPLYTKYGIHWSVYGMYQALDTLTNYLRKESDLYIPGFEIVQVDTSRQPRDTDFDLGYLLNLMENPECEVMGYPKGVVTHDESYVKPRILTVGDSYYLNILHNSDAKKLFSDQHFWYYNKHVYPEQYEKESLVSDLNLKQELMRADILLVAVTERFLYKNLWGFADDAFAALTNTTSYEPFYQALNSILSTDGWFAELIEDAGRDDKLLSELLMYHADYQVYQTDRDAYLNYHGVHSIEKNIRADENWFAKVEKKANDKGISVDEAVEADARWVFENNYPDLFEKWTFRENVKNTILNDPQWLLKTEDKARKRYLSLDEMMDLEAEYLWKKHQSEK